MNSSIGFMRWPEVGMLAAFLALFAGPADTEELAIMTGVGQASGASYNFTLRCDPDLGENQFVIRWSEGQFELTKIINAICKDDPAISPTDPPANFDTYKGEGDGLVNGRIGASATWNLTDAGDPTAADTVEVIITDAIGNVVFELSGPLDEGDHQATGQALLPVQPGVDPENLIHSVFIDKHGVPSDYVRIQLADNAFHERLAPQKPAGDPPGPLPKIQTALEREVAEKDPNERALVVINLLDNEHLPRFPDLATEFFTCELEGPAARRQREIIDDFMERRSRSTEDFLSRFRGGDHDISIVEQFWITNAFLADIRLGDVNELASRDDVLYLQSNQIDVLPPHHDGNPNNDVADGREAIKSDVYFNLTGMNVGCIGLIDTGVRSSHLLFGPPDDNLRIEADCDDGGPTCLDPSSPDFDPGDHHSHGTSTAAILSGNGNLGPDFRGVTRITVDSWNVYYIHCPPQTEQCFSGISGALNAIQQALQAFNRVILIEIQEPTPETGPLATSANDAFDAGAVVIAANGNCAVSTACNVTEGFPNPESVRSPANAHKVIGVGAVNLQTGVTPDYQGFGPTNDGRYKPDIQAPTDTETACEEGIILPDDVVCSDPGTDFSLRNRFGGTSGAAPYAAGAGALLRNWLRKFNTFDPGQTYSLLILSGTEIEPFEERIGAGAIELPTCGFADWGKVTMEPVIITDPPEPGDPVPVAEVDIPIQVGQNNLRLDAALWWPTEPFQATTDIDLHLIDPFGVERAKSNSIRGVFERTRAKAKKSVGQLEPGTWILRIRAPILFFDQTIYWAANLRMKNDLCIRRVPNP